MKKNSSYYIRKTHRFLGVFIGIQFLGWTISGLFFSWNNIDDVHGDHMRKPAKFLAANVDVVAPTEAVKSLQNTLPVDSLHSVQLISVLGKPTYQIRYFSGHSGEGSHLHVHYALADALTGELREPLTEAEATAIAKDNVIENATVSSIEYLLDVDGHHEYREKPLPAYAITFSNPDCTVYVSAEQGTYQTIRHNQWRAFDFLWMFHTMDFAGRDNFNNWLLKILSVFGLLTVISGFTLFIVSSKTSKKLF
jgi:uncharacterized iron-regulated membrane protein